MQQLNEFDTVRYIGPFDRELALASGEVGITLDDYRDGNYEVEFALPDGTTWLQCALPSSLLELMPQGSQPVTPIASAIYSVIEAFERGNAVLFDYPPTGERLTVKRIPDGGLVVTTPSLGTVASVARARRL